MKCDKSTMLLYAVTDRAWVGRQTLYEQVECALRGGATCIQLREKTQNDSDFLEEALKLRGLCKDYGIPFIVNDNVEVALKCHADGVHVGQEDMNATAVRQLIGDSMILGVSCHTLEEAKKAEQAGADYLGVGAVFTTSTKQDTISVSYDTLREIREGVSIPIVAIGGISQDNILELSGSGVDGVALVSAIFSATDITAQTRRLRALSEKMVQSKHPNDKEASSYEKSSDNRRF